MIIVDNRTGSQDLAPRMRAYTGAPEVELATLEFADVAFAGNGPNGDTLIGLEVKKIGDVIACIGGGRFVGHQLPGLLRDYQFPYIVVEGAYREGAGGVLEVPYGQGGWATYSKGFRVEALNNWLTTVQEHAGIRVRQTYNRHATVVLAVSLYHWFQKPWAEHKSLNVIYNPPAAPGVQLGPYHEPTPVERVAVTMPGIKWTRAQAIGKRFATVKEMLAATEEDWQEIEGIGPNTAAKVCQFLGVK